MMRAARFMSRVLAIAVLAALLIVASACRNVDQRAQAVSPPADDAHAQRDVILASTGRVEGASDTIDLGAGVDGVVAEVRVREGDTVRRGDILAVIDRRELHGELSAARAAAESTRQERARLLRGSRQEERERADAEVAAAEAVLRHAEAQHRRAAHLLSVSAVSAAEYDEAQRVLDVGRAQLDAARKRADLVKAPPLPEELAKADADVLFAEERIRTIQQTLEKCLVRAPIDGTVLRIMLRPGETFSLLVPQPIVRLADTSRLRVRAEVDERDVGRVFVGQRVLVRGQVWEGTGVPGRVNRIAAQMGRKTVKTDDPAEKGDRDVMEVMIDLDDVDPRLVVGLRVTTVFFRSPS